MLWGRVILRLSFTDKVGLGPGRRPWAGHASQDILSDSFALCQVSSGANVRDLKNSSQ